MFSVIILVKCILCERWSFVETLYALKISSLHIFHRHFTVQRWTFIRNNYFFIILIIAKFEITIKSVDIQRQWLLLMHSCWWILSAQVCPCFNLNIAKQFMEMRESLRRHSWIWLTIEVTVAVTCFNKSIYYLYV